MSDITIAEGAIREVRSLLEESDLPTTDLLDEKVQILVARNGTEVIGCIGIERYGTQALLRSFTVALPQRNTGIGAKMIEAALKRVKADGAIEVFAITTTAADYLNHFGFEKIERNSLQGAIEQSPQVTGICPEDSTILVNRMRPLVVFMCVHNAGRSQMAAAFLLKKAGELIDVRSAGSEPADQLNPAVIVAMTEVGIDISAEQPKLMTFDLAKRADVIITMGCGDACPVFPGKQYFDWEFDDPAGKAVDEVRQIRDEIAKKVEEFAKSLQYASSSCQ